MLSIETVDSRPCHREEFAVVCTYLELRIEPVRQEREIKIPLHACDVMDLQPLKLLFDRHRRGQERRDDDECPKMRWHSIAQLQRRQRRRSECPRHQIVGERHSNVDSQDAAGDCEEKHPHSLNARARQVY
jgi:hypothetical protein